MSDVFAELDEVMRQEKLAKFWHDNGSAIIAFIVLTILGTAAISGYKSWDAGIREAQTATLLATVEAEDFPTNLDLKALNLRGGLEAVTALQAAAKLMNDDKLDEALAIYTALATSKSAPQDMRELGTLMQARLSAAQENADATVLIQSLSAIANRGKSPWRHHAHLDIAILKANAQQDFEGARMHLKAVLDAQGLPTGLTSRAGSLDHVYALKHATITAEKPAQQ